MKFSSNSFRFDLFFVHCLEVYFFTGNSVCEKSKRHTMWITFHRTAASFQVDNPRCFFVLRLDFEAENSTHLLYQLLSILSQLYIHLFSPRRYQTTLQCTQKEKIKDRKKTYDTKKQCPGVIKSTE